MYGPAVVVVVVVVVVSVDFLAAKGAATAVLEFFVCLTLLTRSLMFFVSGIMDIMDCSRGGGGGHCSFGYSWIGMLLLEQQLLPFWICRSLYLLYCEEYCGPCK